MHALFAPALVSFLSVLSSPLQQPVPVHGVLENPRETHGDAGAFLLTGPTTFGWRTAKLTADIDLDKHPLLVDTGGGNETILSGRLYGTGSFEWRSGGIPQVGPSILMGLTTNPFSGTFTLSKGVLDLEFPDHQNAFSGPLVIGGRDRAIVNLHADETLPDAQSVTFTGPKDTGIVLNGVTETVASIYVLNHATIDFSGSSTLQLVSNSPLTIDASATLTISNYHPGTSRFALKTPLGSETLGRIGFLNPAGLPRGLYRASSSTPGCITPGTRIEPVNVTFPVTENAYAARERLYNIRGLDDITGQNSPIQQGTTIAFFGDSLTWLGGYIAELDRAIATDQTTQRRGIKLINRGINGGGVRQLVTGCQDAAFPGSSPQKPFAMLLGEDHVNVAVVMIGINDVWWRKTSEADFRADLTQLAASAKQQGVCLVLCTMLGRGELPGGANADDAKIDTYCAIIRDVAKQSGCTLADVRAAAQAWWMNTNAALRPDGTPASMPQDILTYDGVHPNAKGNQLLASQLAAGIAKALRGK
ncbi:MAG: SGNH/GDSL hydrolase family protein [Armatimonadota bacterium]